MLTAPRNPSTANCDLFKRYNVLQLIKDVLPTPASYTISDRRIAITSTSNLAWAPILLTNTKWYGTTSKALIMNQTPLPTRSRRETSGILYNSEVISRTWFSTANFMASQVLFTGASEDCLCRGIEPTRVLTEPVDSFSPEPRLSYAIRALDNVGKSHVLQVPCQSVTSFMVQALHSSSVRYTPNVQAKKFVDSPHLSNQTGPLQ
ncbi:unnamed protein product [Aspergillus oryzae]|uniref:Unnamed protein product n=1 Tax=Aspergillus oryzae TaxID=5062 RepID=A0AAN4YD98_ASPOZ|nr:unnamed protein product [Aspergillus oryzae]